MHAHIYACEHERTHRSPSSACNRHLKSVAAESTFGSSISTCTDAKFNTGMRIESLWIMFHLSAPLDVWNMSEQKPRLAA